MATLLEGGEWCPGGASQPRVPPRGPFEGAGWTNPSPVVVRLAYGTAAAARDIKRWSPCRRAIRRRDQLVLDQTGELRQRRAERGGPRRPMDAARIVVDGALDHDRYRRCVDALDQRAE